MTTDDPGGQRPMQAAVGTALRTLPLKAMDPSLLYFAVVHESADLGIDVAQLTTAMQIAAYLHRDDTRSNRKDLPVDVYVTHPFRLVLRLVRYGCRDGTVLCAAALHDTVEDHPDELVALLDVALAGPSSEPGHPAERLATAFGPDVARIVTAVTNPPAPDGQTQQERHAAYQTHVAEVIADPQVFLVKLADFVDNAGSLRYLVDDARRFRLERKYAPLVPVFRSAFEAHRASLPVGADGLARIGRHLTGLETLAKPIPIGRPAVGDPTAGGTTS
jgi:hypothetical protein